MSEADSTFEPAPPPLSLGALFLLFLGFGVRAFGGPVAQIALLKRELVERDGWMSTARFNRLLAVMQALPGPEAHELCVHLGMRARGQWGGLLAGLGFMLPGFVLMLAVSWLYFRLDFDQPWLAAATLGLQAAVIALIVRAVERIGRHALSDPWLWALAGLALVASLLGVSFWIVLGACGGAYALIRMGRRTGAVAVLVLAAGLALLTAGQADGLAGPPAGGVSSPASPWLLFLAGLKAGLLTFGGAYTAIPFVRADTVERSWISEGQFLDGLALSGVLPAPLIIFCTFVGYAAGGLPGALLITAGVFLPAFAFSLIFYDRLEAVIETPGLSALLEGVTAGVVGLIAATTLQLGWRLLAGEGGWPAAAIALGGLVALHVWRSGWAVPAVLLAGAAAMTALRLSGVAH
ncbi:chromate efflux transporter [Brevundimonas sp. 2R-24]|uniref:Chromate efflux transporter n=1 Tax=Peiella sedimenti TaxID=3061083 RepID=A0ABT8SJS0_9CAUL|nr:chromate efflux transporter [Caulobacteraceae bacterium XZ-24]